MSASVFRNQVVILTGACGGIGRELARQLAAVGARLVLASPETERLEALAQELAVSHQPSAISRAPAGGRGSGLGVRNEGASDQGSGARAETQDRRFEIQNSAVRRPTPDAHGPSPDARRPTPDVHRPLVVTTDVTDEAQCRDLVARAVAAFGRVDVLINNAGIGQVSRFYDLPDLTAFERVMRVNFFGSVYCTYAALPHLVASRGRIVGVASVLGKFAGPKLTAYCASKHALAGFYDSLRCDLRRKRVSVTVAYPNLVASGFTERVLESDGRSRGDRGGEALARRMMSPSRCARLMLRAAARRRREIVMSPSAKFALWAKLLIPRLLDAYMRLRVRELE